MLPLHLDPEDNDLIRVYGRSRVSAMSPAEKAKLRTELALSKGTSVDASRSNPERTVADLVGPDAGEILSRPAPTPAPAPSLLQRLSRIAAPADASDAELERGPDAGTIRRNDPDEKLGSALVGLGSMVPGMGKMVGKITGREDRLPASEVEERAYQHYPKAYATGQGIGGIAASAAFGAQSFKQGAKALGSLAERRGMTKTALALRDPVRAAKLALKAPGGKLDAADLALNVGGLGLTASDHEDAGMALPATAMLSFVTSNPRRATNLKSALESHLQTFSPKRRMLPGEWKQLLLDGEKPRGGRFDRAEYDLGVGPLLDDLDNMHQSDLRDLRAEKIDWRNNLLKPGPDGVNQLPTGDAAKSARRTWKQAEQELNDKRSLTAQDIINRAKKRKITQEMRSSSPKDRDLELTGRLQAINDAESPEEAKRAYTRFNDYVTTTYPETDPQTIYDAYQQTADGRHTTRYREQVFREQNVGQNGGIELDHFDGRGAGKGETVRPFLAREIKDEIENRDFDVGTGMWRDPVELPTLDYEDAGANHNRLSSSITRGQDILKTSVMPEEEFRAYLKLLPVKEGVGVERRGQTTRSQALLQRQKELMDQTTREFAVKDDVRSLEVAESQSDATNRAKADVERYGSTGLRLPVEGLYRDIRNLGILEEAARGKAERIIIHGSAQQLKRYGTDRITVENPLMGRSSAHAMADGEGTYLHYIDSDLPAAKSVGRTYFISDKITDPRGFAKAIGDLERNTSPAEFEQYMRPFGGVQPGLRGFLQQYADDIQKLQKAEPGTMVEPRARGMRANYDVAELNWYEKFFKGANIPYRITRDPQSLAHVIDYDHKALAEYIAAGGLTVGGTRRSMKSLQNTKGMTRLEGMLTALGSSGGAIAGGMDEEGNIDPAGAIGGAIAGGVVGGVAGGITQGALNRVRGRRVPDLPAMPGQTGSTVGSMLDWGGVRGRAAEEAAIAPAQAPGRAPWGNAADRATEALSNDAEYLTHLGREWERMGVPANLNPERARDRVKGSDHVVREAIAGEGLRDMHGQIMAPAYGTMIRQTLGTTVADIKNGFEYLVANRIVGRGPQSVADRPGVFENAQRVVAEQGMNANVQAFARGHARFTEALGNYAVQSGMWTPEQWQAFRDSDAFYVPFGRVQAELKRGGSGAGDILTVDGRVERFLGSARDIADPAEATFDYANRIIRQSNRYMVRAKLFDVAELLGDEMAGIRRLPGRPTGDVVGHGVFDPLLENFEHDPRKNEVISRIGANGEREYAAVTDPHLRIALESLNPEALMDPKVQQVVSATLGFSKRLLTAGATGMNVAFSLGTNLFRDPWDLMMRSQNHPRFGDIVRGISTAMVHEVPHLGPWLNRYFGRLGITFDHLPDLAEIRQAGLGGVSQYSQAVDTKSLLNQFAPTTVRQKVRGRARRILTSPLAVLEKFGDASDLAPRAADIIAGRRLYTGVMPKAERLAEEAHIGRRFVDYHDKPGNTALRFANSITPFLGASLQNSRRFVETLRQSGGARRVATVGGSVALMAAITWAYGHSFDKEGMKIIEQKAGAERARGIGVPLKDEGHTLLIPLPPEVSLFSSAVTAMLDAAFGEDEHALNLVKESFKRLLPPTPVADNPLIGAYLDINANERDFTGGPIETWAQEKLLPEDRVKSDTPAIWEEASKVLPLSPVQTEYAAGRLGGSGLKSVIETGTNWFLDKKAPRIEKEFADNPINPLSALRRDASSPNTQAKIDVYKAAKKHTEVQATIANALKNENYKRADELVKKYGNPDERDALFDAIKSKEKEFQEQVKLIQGELQRGGSQQNAQRRLKALRKEQQSFYTQADRMLKLHD